MHLSPLPYKCHMPHPTYYYSCHSSDTIGRGVRIMQHVILQFSPVSCYFLSPKPAYLSQHFVCSSTPFFP
jgi:hypothetical protein